MAQNSVMLCRERSGHVPSPPWGEVASGLLYPGRSNRMLKIYLAPRVQWSMRTRESLLLPRCPQSTAHFHVGCGLFLISAHYAPISNQ